MRAVEVRAYAVSTQEYSEVLKSAATVRRNGNVSVVARAKEEETPTHSEEEP
jgi:hypothetical protein